MEAPTNEQTSDAELIKQAMEMVANGINKRMEWLNNDGMVEKIDSEMNDMIRDYRLGDDFSKWLIQAYYGEMKAYLSDGHLTTSEFIKLTNSASQRYKEKLEKYSLEKKQISADTKEFLDYLFVQ